VFLSSFYKVFLSGPVRFLSGFCRVSVRFLHGSSLVFCQVSVGCLTGFVRFSIRFLSGFCQVSVSFFSDFLSGVCQVSVKFL
jgi:hypothetical protein